MLAREFENHSIENRRAPTSAFDMSMSLLSNPALSYPMSYGPSSLGYHAAAGGPTSINPYGGIMPPQSLYLPSSYAMNQNLSQVRQVPTAGVELHESPLVKPEGKPLEDETYMYYEVPLPTSQSPRVPGEATFGTDVDTLMRAIQIKTENRRRSNPVPDTHDGSDRSLSNGAESDIGRDCYSEPGQGFPRSRKKYQCSVPSCSKVFFQKTHLEIHIRAHTGAKPFVSSLWISKPVV